MAQKNRAVFLKLSGERLAHPDKTLWNPAAVKTVGEKLAKAHRQLEKLGIHGMTVVPGSGNIARGEELKKQGIAPGMEDLLGRISLIQNPIVIAGELDKLNVPNVILLARKMRFSDIDFKPQLYSARLAKEAHREGKVVLIAGGTGDSGRTTDSAVVFYAEDYKKHNGGEVTVLKGTQVDGVFDGDPRHDASAKRYRVISAFDMLADYEKFKVVDKLSLKHLTESGLSMLVYKDSAHDLAEVFKHDLGRNHGEMDIGTLIVPEAVSAIYY